jgi:hypothetical protein
VEYIIEFMNNPDHNYIVPLVGGPKCGESVSTIGSYLISTIPVPHEGVCYIYELQIEQGEYGASVYYKYTHNKQKIRSKKQE